MRIDLVALHVTKGVIVSIDQYEFELVDLDTSSNVEICRLEVTTLVRKFVFSLLKELA